MPNPKPAGDEQEQLPSLEDSLEGLVGAPIPQLADFLREHWYELSPDTPEWDKKVQELRYKQIATALVAMYDRLRTLEDRVYGKPKPPIQ